MGAVSVVGGAEQPSGKGGISPDGPAPLGSPERLNRTYRVEVIASVRRVGVVDIQAATAEEAKACVERLGAEEGYTALPVQWTESTRLGPLEVIEVSEAA